MYPSLFFVSITVKDVKALLPQVNYRVPNTRFLKDKLQVSTGITFAFSFIFWCISSTGMKNTNLPPLCFQRRSRPGVICHTHISHSSTELWCLMLRRVWVSALRHSAEEVFKSLNFHRTDILQWEMIPKQYERIYLSRCSSQNVDISESLSQLLLKGYDYSTKILLSWLHLKMFYIDINLIKYGMKSIPVQQVMHALIQTSK